MIITDTPRERLEVRYGTLHTSPGSFWFTYTNKGLFPDLKDARTIILSVEEAQQLAQFIQNNMEGGLHEG